MDPALASAVERTTRRRIAIHILPFLWFLYVIAFLDRVNVAYAALTMSHDLGFSDRVFGLGAGIFFVGYVVLEIPGALIVERWSARLWISRIMITWGIITVFVGFVHTAHQFYLLRFLLGAAEAGFFPGVIVYLTHWFTERDLAKAVASFMAALPLSNLLGSPIAGAILRIHWRGLEGWRWLFIIEGIPAILLGIVTLAYLTDWPRQAGWLTESQREWITSELHRRNLEKAAVRSYRIGEALRQKEVILLAAIYFFATTGYYGFTIWLPTILKRASGFGTWHVTLLAAVPYLVALVAQLLNGWHSDQTQERRWHTAGPLFIGAAAMCFAILYGSRFWVQLGFFTIYAAGVHAYLPSFWALPTLTLGESAAAASIGMINALGNLGGFVGPLVMGYLVTQTGSFTTGLGWLLVNLVGGGVLVFFLRGHTLQTKTVPQAAFHQS
jgi:MFS transporter, ACS family, tartrate transporter